jgi:hypothetical protein
MSAEIHRILYNRKKRWKAKYLRKYYEGANWRLIYLLLIIEILISAVILFSDVFLLISKIMVLFIEIVHLD